MVQCFSSKPHLVCFELRLILTSFPLPLPLCSPTFLLFLGRCCQAYCRNIAVSYRTRTQVRTKQMPPPLLVYTLQSHTRAETDRENQAVGVMSGMDAQWVGHICLSPYLCAIVSPCLICWPCNILYIRT